MLIVLFLFWLLLEGRWSVEIALTGLVLSALIYLFSWRFLGWSPRRDIRLLRALPAFLRFAGCLILDILVSGLKTMRLIWSPTQIAQPRLTSLRTGLRTRTGRVLLANAITMTPGTMTVDILEDRLLVHCLDTEMAEGLVHSATEKRISALEGEP